MNTTSIVTTRAFKADMPDERERRVSDTGASKEFSPIQMSLVPPANLEALAEHFARGAVKYGPHNYRNGMPRSWHYDALQRHAMRYWGGENYDQETGSHHMIAVAWHALAIHLADTEGTGEDDRYLADDAYRLPRIA